MIKNSPRHFLQSDEWAQFQKTLGYTVIKRSGDGWEYIAVKERGDGTIGRRFSRLYCPYGPQYRDESALKHALDDLESQARNHKVDYVRVEPLCGDRTVLFNGLNGYKKLHHSFQPEQTLLIDISVPFEETLQQMSKTNRYLWNKAERNNLSFNISYNTTDLEHFLLMMQETADRTGTVFRRGQYYALLLETLGASKAVGVAYAYHEKEVLVGVLFADDMVAKTRYYLYAGSFDKARQHSANSPLVSYLLYQAKEKGLQTFDFFGVAPADVKDHRWAGFSKFKRSFGGEELVFPGTWEKPVRPLRYGLMSAIRSLKT